MRKLLAIAILISFVAPASAADWLGGSVRGHSGTLEGYSAAMKAAASQRANNKAQANDAQIRANNAQAAGDQQSNAARNAAQDKFRNSRDVVRKMLELQAGRGCRFCR